MELVRKISMPYTLPTLLFAGWSTAIPRWLKYDQVHYTWAFARGPAWFESSCSAWQSSISKVCRFGDVNKEHLNPSPSEGGGKNWWLRIPSTTGWWWLFIESRLITNLGGHHRTLFTRPTAHQQSVRGRARGTWSYGSHQQGIWCFVRPEYGRIWQIMDEHKQQFCD